jgi:endoglucanase
VRLAACFLLLCATLCAEPPAGKGFVRTDGRSLVTPQGQKLILRGIGLGNWFVPEGYMLQLDKGAGSAREIERLFNELIGPAEAADFWREYRKRYVTERDIQQIRAFGFNSVRIPLHYKFFLSGGEEFQLLDQTVAWCRKAGLYVILDLHCAPAGQTGTNIDDSWGYPWLFESKRDQETTVALWKRLAARYATDPAVLGYDLLNEPIPPFPGLAKYNASLEPLYRKITKAIREVDPNHVVILEGAQWASNFDVFGPPQDGNTLYSFHKYWTAPAQDVIQPYLDFRERHNVPVWLGESGENSDQWIADFTRMLEKNEVGWCYWPYKKMGASSAVATIAKPVYWDEVVAYASEPGTSGATEQRIAKRPTLEHSREALRDLLDKILLANCRLNAGYVHALGLKPPAR